MESYKKSVLGISLFVVFFLFSAGIYKSLQQPLALRIKVEGNPVIGQGSLQFVVFEDFYCEHCRDFTTKVLPNLLIKYVDTGFASFAVIPVCFSEGSKPATNAALSVYEIAPNRFKDFVLKLGEKKLYFKNDILGLASQVGGIDLMKLEARIDSQQYYSQIDRNLIYAQKLIGPDFGTPTLYINGIEAPTDSFHSLESKIEKVQRSSL